jgi:hypothetical protein
MMKRYYSGDKTTEYLDEFAEGEADNEAMLFLLKEGSDHQKFFADE